MTLMEIDHKKHRNMPFLKIKMVSFYFIFDIVDTHCMYISRNKFQFIYTKLSNIVVTCELFYAMNYYYFSMYALLNRI